MACKTDLFQVLHHVLQAAGQHLAEHLDNLLALQVVHTFLPGRGEQQLHKQVHVARKTTLLQGRGREGGGGVISFSRSFV